MFSNELLEIGPGVTGKLGEDHRLVVKPQVLATNAGSFPARHCQEESRNPGSPESRGYAESGFLVQISISSIT
jgi:hypothetical protein